MGYTADDSGARCLSDSVWDNLILVTDTLRKQVYQVSLSTGSAHALPGVQSENPIAVDYDPFTGKLVFFLHDKDHSYSSRA